MVEFTYLPFKSENLQTFIVELGNFVLNSTLSRNKSLIFTTSVLS